MNDPKGLKRLALIPLVAGVAALVVGVVWVVQFIVSVVEQDRLGGQGRDSGPPLGIFLAMGGLILLGVGAGMRHHANRGKMLRSEMKRILDDPVLREAMRDVAHEVAGGERVCPRCKATAVAGAEFCGECGARLANCPHCGADQAPGSRFCIRCGRPFEGAPGGNSGGQSI
jgi:hypothetical protein